MGRGVIANQIHSQYPAKNQCKTRQSCYGKIMLFISKETEMINNSGHQNLSGYGTALGKYILFTPKSHIEMYIFCYFTAFRDEIYLYGCTTCFKMYIHDSPQFPIRLYITFKTDMATKKAVCYRANSFFRSINCAVLRVPGLVSRAAYRHLPWT